MEDKKKTPGILTGNLGFIICLKIQKCSEDSE